MTNNNFNLLMDLEPLLDSIFTEWKREQMPVYIWLNIDGSKYSWAVSKNRHDHVEEPFFVYNGKDADVQVVTLI